MTKYEVLMGGGLMVLAGGHWRSARVRAPAGLTALYIEYSGESNLTQIAPTTSFFWSALGDAGKLMILWVFPNQKNSARNRRKTKNKDIETIRIPTYAQSIFCEGFRIQSKVNAKFWLDSFAVDFQR